MMLTLNKSWRSVLILGTLLLLALGARPAQAEGKDKALPRGSDSRQFIEELRSGGAIKFYEDTEDMLRAGKFERAYIRYIFLNAHIRGQSLDAALVPMVEQRLHFLRGQMRLGEGFHYAAREDRPVRQRRPAKPACPPPQPKEAKKADAEDKPPEIVLPAVPEDKAAPPPQEEAKTPADEAPKPPPPPSTWEKIKRKLLFWRKDGG
jgi:hypothetical protein